MSRQTNQKGLGCPSHCSLLLQQWTDNRKRSCSCQPRGWDPRVCPSWCHSTPSTEPPRMPLAWHHQGRNGAGAARTEVRGQREASLKGRRRKMAEAKAHESPRKQPQKQLAGFSPVPHLLPRGWQNILNSETHQDNPAHCSQQGHRMTPSVLAQM